MLCVARGGSTQQITIYEKETLHQIIWLGWLLPLSAVSCSSRVSISNERSGEGEAAPPPGSTPSLLQHIVSCILLVRY